MKKVADLKIGTVTHYFDKIGVAIVDLVDTVHIGETIKIGDPGFTQTIESMQVEHEKIQAADRGQSIGLKVNQPANKGDEVIRVS